MNIQFKSSEVLILIVASAMSFMANLPDTMLGDLVDRKVLLAALTALVVVAMFRYLQMMLLLTISTLVIGANLPSGLASELGISQFALLVSLGSLIAIALLNRAVKILPAGTENPVTDITAARQAMLEAIAKGDQAALLHMLAMNANINFIQDGTSPLHLAAEKGYPDIVRLLISHGAVFHTKNEAGQTPLDIALTKKKFVQTTEILFNAQTNYATSGQAESRRADAEMWREQNGY